MLIEQAQILTTHNLAVLFDAYALADQLAPDLRGIAERVFTWILRLLERPPLGGHEMLIDLKNAAYAWRQLVFFLSFLPDVPSFLGGARAQLAATPAAFHTRFEPALRGLELAAAGHTSSDAAFAAAGGRVFTGWAVGGHWLAPAATSR